jgi:hypothetical protein
VEILVGALVVLGFLAILVRFIGRDSSGEIRLPRVVDDSIGMWTLRRITGRRLGARDWGDEIDGDQPLDPNASRVTRAALGATAAADASMTTATVASAANAAGAATATSAANAANPTAVPARSTPARIPPARVPPRRDIAVRPRPNRRLGYSASMLSSTPVLDLRRRQEARARPRRSSRRRRFAAVGVMAALLIVAIVALGFAAQQRPPQGQVLAATGRPQLPAQVAVEAGGGSPPAPSSVVSRDVTLPRATITGLTTSTIVGSSKLRLTLTWTLTDSGSGLRGQLLQRRTDGGSWVTVSLASASTRKAAFAMSRGHMFAFRIRGTDRSGNVGLFVSKSIRI